MADLRALPVLAAATFALLGCQPSVRQEAASVTFTPDEQLERLIDPTQQPIRDIAKRVHEGGTLTPADVTLLEEALRSNEFFIRAAAAAAFLEAVEKGVTEVQPVRIRFQRARAAAKTVGEEIYWDKALAELPPPTEVPR